MINVLSMTAFAAHEFSIKQGLVKMEMLARPGRFLELSVISNKQLPSSMMLEDLLNQELKKNFARGQISCCISFIPAADNALAPINETAVKGFCERCHQIKSLVGSDTVLTISLPHLFTLLRHETRIAETNTSTSTATDNSLSSSTDAAFSAPCAEISQEQTLNEQYRQAVSKLIHNYLDNAQAQGQELLLQLNEELERSKACIDAIAGYRDSFIQQERSRLQKICQRWRHDLSPVIISPERMEEELALCAQKVDITEECDRLRCHYNTMRSLLDGSDRSKTDNADSLCFQNQNRILEESDTKSRESRENRELLNQYGIMILGKKIDFLLQEFLRECNTITSKTNVIEVTCQAIELKVSIENMRDLSRRLM